MTDKRADEREIAKWLGAQVILDVDHWTTGTIVISADRVVISGIGANLASAWLPWLPSEDANLWPGILARADNDPVRNAFMAALVDLVGVFGCPKDRSMWGVLRSTCEQKTRALAQAIREMQGGG